MNWKRSLLSVVIIIPVMILFWFGLSRDPNVIPSPLPGHAAPDFVLEVMDPQPSKSTELVSADAGETVDGPLSEERVALASHRGDVVVLNFWASWCLACRDEHRPLSEVSTLYKDRGVAFYGVLYNDKPDPARRWLRQMGGQSYPTLLDPGSRTAIDFGLYGVPETFFIDREGRVAYKHIGPVTRTLLIQKIDEILAASEEQAS